MQIELKTQLQCCIEKLDPVSREILVLRHYEDLKFIEMADHLGKNINTVAGIYRRAMRQLAGIMKRQELKDESLRRKRFK